MWVEVFAICNSAHEVQKETQLGNNRTPGDGERQAADKPAKHKRHHPDHQNNEKHTCRNRERILAVAVGGDEEGAKSGTAKNQGDVEHGVLRMAHAVFNAGRLIGCFSRAFHYGVERR